MRIHAQLPRDDNTTRPATTPLQVMDLFGIERSRAVWGPIAARIAHIPEGVPCGEPYALPQALLRDVVRGRLGLRPAVDVWGDGAAAGRGFRHATSGAPAPIVRASVKYLARLHACLVDRYAQISSAAGSPSAAEHPIAPLVRAAAADAEADAEAAGAVATGVAPRAVLIERGGSRAIYNAGDLRAALDSALPTGALTVFGSSAGGSQSDHLSTFASADLIVAPHGAGQTNSLVCWPGTVMLELMPTSGLTNLVYPQMALLLGHGFTSFAPAGGSYSGGIPADVPRVVEAAREALRPA